MLTSGQIHQEEDGSYARVALWVPPGCEHGNRFGALGEGQVLV